MTSRASHASWVADRHGVLAAVRRLGHSNASVTTLHYARAIKELDDDVAKGLVKRPLTCAYAPVGGRSLALLREV